MDESALSQHPTDRLIRELIRTGRNTKPGEVDQIVERVATAPFDHRVVSVPSPVRGLMYLDRRVRSKELSLLIHVVQRILIDRQWNEGVTEREYVSDLWRAVRSPEARVAVYARREGHMVATLSANVVSMGRRGPKALPLLFVVYSADRGMIVSGYQVSSLQAVDVPGEALWLN